jgi:hypothetical protein
MAKWMIENGSDVHQGGDGPLMRAALKGNRIPMMELLVSHGADVKRGSEPIEARARVLAECLNDLGVAADRRGGVVATHQLVAQALQKLGHRHLL